MPRQSRTKTPLTREEREVLIELIILSSKHLLRKEDIIETYYGRFDTSERSEASLDYWIENIRHDLQKEVFA